MATIATAHSTGVTYLLAIPQTTSTVQDVSYILPANLSTVIVRKCTINSGIIFKLSSGARLRVL